MKGYEQNYITLCGRIKKQGRETFESDRSNMKERRLSQNVENTIFHRRKSTSLSQIVENAILSRRKSTTSSQTVEIGILSRRKSIGLSQNVENGILNRRHSIGLKPRGLRYETDLAPLFLGLLDPYEKVTYVYYQL